ncbi:MAG TPA: hypothetical protein VIV57_18250 [Anaeromyxobacter sp.]
MVTRNDKDRRAALGWALALAFAACRTGAAGPPPAPARPPPADGAFGVFVAFAPEFAPFWTSLGLDYAGYQDWAGARMEDLGATWTRSNLQLVWDFVEPEVEPLPGAESFDWTASDAVFAAAARYGVRYLAVFHEGAPTWGQPLRDPLANLEAYERFVEAAVERYDGDGLDDAPAGIVVRHWQIGNETGGWTASGRTAEDYVRWFEATAAAIGRADPEARVVLVASTNGDRMDPLHAYAIPALAARGVRIDAVDIHHWGKADLASSTMDAVPAYRALLDGAGLPDAEIWSCEHGTYVGAPVTTPGECTACPSGWVCDPMGRCVSPCTSSATCSPDFPVCDTATGLCVEDAPPQEAADQARSLVYRYVVNRHLGVRRILWNNLASWQCFAGQCGGVPDRLGLVADGYGPGETLADVGRPRPSYFAYRMLAALTDDPAASPDGRVDLGDPALRVYAYRLNATGRRAFVAWADSSREAAIPFSRAAALVRGFLADEDGVALRVQRIEAAGGLLSVPLDPDPVWIEDVP